MKSKLIIECGVKEEASCIREAMDCYKEWLEEQISKNISARNEKYYRERLEILSKVIQELKRIRGKKMLKEIKTLKGVSIEYNIPLDTLQYRLRWLEKDIEYKSMGIGQGTILTTEGVKKITQTM